MPLSATQKALIRPQVKETIFLFCLLARPFFPPVPIQLLGMVTPRFPLKITITWVLWHYLHPIENGARVGPAAQYHRF